MLPYFFFFFFPVKCLNETLDVFYLKPLFNIVATAIKYMTINNVRPWWCLKSFGCFFYVLIQMEMQRILE